MKERALELNYNTLVENEYVSITKEADKGLSFLQNEIYRDPSKFDNKFRNVRSFVD